MPNSWILKGGQIYDGSGDPPFRGDIRIVGNTIERIAPSLPKGNHTVIDAAGLIVAPGLIDLHTHVYDGMNLHSVEPADVGLRTGVTTMLDMGSAGSLTYPVFCKYIMPSAAEDIFVLLNIAQYGVQGHPEIAPFIGDLYEALHLNVDSLVKCYEAHPERIVGVKVRLTAALSHHRERNERIALQSVLEAARATGLPCYVHHIASSIPLEEVIASLRPGDVLTHVYHGHADSGFTGPDGAPGDALCRAREKGVHFDVGHGSGAFVWRVAEPACQNHGFWPDAISTDVHRFNIQSPVVDLPTTMSKFLHLGMKLERIIRCTTMNPATIMGQRHEIGRLLPGRRADITILQLDEGAHPLVDAENVTRTATQRIVPVSVFKNGRHVPCRRDGAFKGNTLVSPA